MPQLLNEIFYLSERQLDPPASSGIYQMQQDLMR